MIHRSKQNGTELQKTINTTTTQTMRCVDEHQQNQTPFFVYITTTKHSIPTQNHVKLPLHLHNQENKTTRDQTRKSYTKHTIPKAIPTAIPNAVPTKNKDTTHILKN